MNYKYLQIFNSPTDNLLQILKENVVGTPQHGMLYQHLEVEKKIRNISAPYFVNLVKGKSIVGTCCFCSRDTFNDNTIITSYYIRYFSFKEFYRRRQALTNRNKLHETELRKELKNILEADLVPAGRNSFFHYAYVDPRNIRSVQLCKEFGFVPVRKFSTLLFGRFHPEKHPNVFLINGSEVETMRENLKNFYGKYTMFSFENLFNNRRYYVWKDKEGKILAGVQAEPDRWKILKLPGLSGKFLQNVISSLPYFRRFLGKEFKFLTLEGIYYLPGHEKKLELLFEHVLAEHRIYNAMLWADTGSGLYKTIRGLQLGLLDKINNEVYADVIVKCVRMSEEQKTVLENRPAYISGWDIV